MDPGAHAESLEEHLESLRREVHELREEFTASAAVRIVGGRNMFDPLQLVRCPKLEELLRYAGKIPAKVTGRQTETAPDAVS